MRVISRTTKATVLAVAALVATTPAAAPTAVAARSAAVAPDPLDGPWLARLLGRTTTGADAFRHLRVFQRIADANGGIRANGTPGFAASADYVARRLQEAGYQVQRQPVPYIDYHVDAESAEEVSPQDRQVRPMVMLWSPVTPVGGFTANLVVLPPSPAGTAGCSPDDYSGLPVQGSIVLLARASCGYTAQQKVIAGLGGRAMMLYLVTPSPENIWRLHVFTPSAFTIPSATVSQQQAEELAADAAQAPVQLHLELRGHQISGTTENLLAETRGGRPDRIVMAGAHLDSVTEGPGINDNVSSGSALLATAIRLAPYQDRVTNKVRFAWWGAEELVDVGSDYYVASLSASERADIALYINFELIASPNFVRFIMDGDASNQPPGTPPGPPGSGAVEHVFEHYFDQVGLPYEQQNIAAVGSDHEPFMAVGIPIGGMDGGTLGVKTPAEAATFGGQAGQLYDHCYHQPCDTLANINRQALDENVPAIAWVIGRFASDASDVVAGSAAG